MMNIINNIKNAFWFFIMVLDMVCIVLFSVKLITDFSVFNAFVFGCFIVSGVLSVNICKNIIVNIKRAIKINSIGIVSIYQLQHRA